VVESPPSIPAASTVKVVETSHPRPRPDISSFGERGHGWYTGFVRTFVPNSRLTGRRSLTPNVRRLTRE